MPGGHRHSLKKAPIHRRSPQIQPARLGAAVLAVMPMMTVLAVLAVMSMVTVLAVLTAAHLTVLAVLTVARRTVAAQAELLTSPRRAYA